jgi:hypothetical protein
MCHNSLLCASQLLVVHARVGHKSIVITRQSMVITRQGDTRRTRMRPTSAATAMAVRDNCLLCSAHDEVFYAYQPWKDIEIKFSQKDFF